MRSPRLPQNPGMPAAIADCKPHGLGADSNWSVRRANTSAKPEFLLAITHPNSSGSDIDGLGGTADAQDVGCTQHERGQEVSGVQTHVGSYRWRPACWVVHERTHPGCCNLADWDLGQWDCQDHWSTRTLASAGTSRSRSSTVVRWPVRLTNFRYCLPQNWTSCWSPPHAGTTSIQMSPGLVQIPRM